jgi:hypothetical protein
MAAVKDKAFRQSKQKNNLKSILKKLNCGKSVFRTLAYGKNSPMLWDGQGPI